MILLSYIEIRIAVLHLLKITELKFRKQTGIYNILNSFMNGAQPSVEQKVQVVEKPFSKLQNVAALWLLFRKTLSCSLLLWASETEVCVIGELLCL